VKLAAAHQPAGDKASRHIDLLLAVEGIEQSSGNLPRRRWQLVEPVLALARQDCRRHIQVTREIERHGPWRTLRTASTGAPGSVVPLPIRLSAWWKSSLRYAPPCARCKSPEHAHERHMP
jgi:hypothetical protein